MKKLFVSVVLSLSIICVNNALGQIVVDMGNDDKNSFPIEGIYKVSQNGKVLSINGKKLLKMTDITNFRVPAKKDTFVVTLKQEALNRLDSTPGSYEENKKIKKKEVKK